MSGPQLRTRENADRILALLGEGFSLREIAGKLGFRENASLISNWGRNDPGFRDQYMRARSRCQAGKVAESVDVRLRGAIRIDGGSGCWVWCRRVNEWGYGTIGVGSRSDGTRKQNAFAHRIAYETWVGPIPAGMCVLHKCDNPPCINPEHLWLGTNADNIADRTKKGRGNIKVTKQDIDNIRSIRASTNLSLAAIGDQIGVSSTTVGRWLK